jgi:DNA-binding LacI/PurR family transcriptional regulator
MEAETARYKMVANELRRGILSGQLTPGTLLPSESELMSQFRIGRGTARAAIRILVHEELVTVRRGARTTVLGRAGSELTDSRVFGLAYYGILSFSHAYNIAVLQGMNSVLKDHPHELEMIDLSIPQGARLQGPNRDKFRRCAGIFIMSSEFETPDIQDLHDAGKHLVGLGVSFDRSAGIVREILVDTHRGMRNLVAHLVDLGHRRFGVVLVVGYERKSTRYINRVVLEGLHEAIHRDGIEIDSRWIRQATEFSRDAGYRAGMQLLNDPGEKPTAIVTIDDTLALGVQEAAREVGLAVPADLSITGVGHYFPEADLTTFAVPGFKVGARAAETMLAACEGRKIQPTTPLLPPLIIGTSTTFAPRRLTTVQPQ